MTIRLPLASLACLALLLTSAPLLAQARPGAEVDKWVLADGQAAGTDPKAADEALAYALRNAVESACGTFLTAQSEARDYQTVYDQVLSNTAGYVIEYKIVKAWTEDDLSHARVRARVSTKKFEENWARIAHTLNRENNPRMIVAIVDADRDPKDENVPPSSVQNKIEEFLLAKNIELVDRQTISEVTKRDILLAALKDDEKEVASVGARFKADVVLLGRAEAKYGKTLSVRGVDMHQFTASLSVRVVQSDSGRVLTVKTFGPITTNVLQKGGGAEKALAKLADESNPAILTAVVDAWRKRETSYRTIQISVSGMDFGGWKTFRKEAETLRPVKALRLREITESVAHIDVEYTLSAENLADQLTELETVKLDVTEITANRVKFKVAE